MSDGATGSTHPRARLAPGGVLRAAINVGNPVLARIAADGRPEGVSVDLARALADRLGVDVSLVVFDTAGGAVQAAARDEVDIGFFAVDPLRAETIAFTDAYVLIEGWYLVRHDSPLRRYDEVDRADISVMVGTGSAYDLYLTRQLRQARVLRAPTSPAVVEAFLQAGADVAAGVRQQLEFDARRLGGLRLLDGRFMVIRQAMGCPRTRGVAAAEWLAGFVEEQKASGFVAHALARHGIEGAAVAPRDALDRQ